MSSPVVSVFEPRISVLLHKTVSRTELVAGVPVSDRFGGAASTIDLTPFLGDGSVVRTHKSIGEAAGAFSIFLADKPGDERSGSDSLYGIAEPMDLIEIRMAREPSSGKLPMVMRGFVSSCRRRDMMTPDGKPARGVMISGQDYGKIWQQLQILFLPGYVVGQDLISNFQLFERYEVGFKTVQRGVEFFGEAFEKIINPYIDRFMPASSPMPREIALDIGNVRGVTSVSGLQNTEGTIHTLLSRYLDIGVWNEMFIEDRDDAVWCVLRPKPYKSVAGDKVNADAPDIEVVDVAGSEIVELDVGRSDADLANYYWVRQPTFDSATELFRRQFDSAGTKSTVLLGKYANAREDLYGIRLMFVDTQMAGEDITTFNSGLPETANQSRDTSVLGWIDDRRSLLVEQNKDNVLFESGTAVIRGNPKIRAGQAIRVSRGAFQAEYYVTGVQHTYAPFSAPFTTMLSLDRGRGFIERARLNVGATSPYYAERS